MTTTTSSKGIEVRTLLAGFWSIFGAIYILLITFAHIPQANVRFADTILGFLLGTLIATLINWYFGGAKEKDVIHEGSPQTPPADPAAGGTASGAEDEAEDGSSGQA